jgi:hypothetical protein
VDGRIAIRPNNQTTDCNFQKFIVFWVAADGDCFSNLNKRGLLQENRKKGFSLFSLKIAIKFSRKSTEVNSRVVASETSSIPFARALSNA